MYTGAYRTPNDFANDMHMIWSNCMKYNQVPLPFSDADPIRCNPCCLMFKKVMNTETKTKTKTKRQRQRQRQRQKQNNGNNKNNDNDEDRHRQKAKTKAKTETYAQR